MNKTMPRTPKEEPTKTITQIIEQYKNTTKKLAVNIVEVKPNHVIARQIELAPPVVGPNGERIYLLNSSDAGDELVFEVIMVGAYNSAHAMEVKVGDRLIVRNSAAIYLNSSTKLSVLGEEQPVLAMISTDDILFKVEYSKA